MFPTSSKRDRNMMILNQDQTEDQREVEKCKGKTSLEHISDATLAWQREDGKSKEITETHEIGRAHV